MKKGFAAELDARAKAFNKVKSELENLFAQQISEEDLKKDPTKIASIDNVLRSCEEACTSYHGTLRGIKLAVETWVRYHAYGHEACYNFKMTWNMTWNTLQYPMFAITQQVQYHIAVATKGEGKGQRFAEEA